MVSINAFKGLKICNCNMKLVWDVIMKGGCHVMQDD